MINIIIAVDKNWGIGNKNNLLYHFPSDLKRFKELTSGKVVVMGRKTWESLPKKLPNRTNIVLSSSTILNNDPDHIFSDIESVLEISKNNDIWVIGGAEICRLFLPYAERIELTIVDAVREYDANISFIKDALNDFKSTGVHYIKDIDKISGEELYLRFVSYKK